MIATSFAQNIRALHDEIDRRLIEAVPREPESLYEPIHAALAAGGKRVRPILTALCADLSGFGQGWQPAATAVELLHTFTLVHDDIMDNAPSRRGKPTMHVAYNVNTAILSGDVLIALALEQVAKSQSPQVARMIEEFSLGFRLVCEGQALDKDFETRNDISIEEYIHMIDLKTSKVLELAAVLGAQSGDAIYTEELRSFAHHLGLAFQINDDLLDLTGDEASFGKTIGGDILEGKRTLLFVAATRHYLKLDTKGRTLMDRIRDRQATNLDIPSARTLFRDLGVLDEAAHMAERETNFAKAALTSIPDTPPKERLLAFSSMLLGRMS